MRFSGKPWEQLSSAWQQELPRASGEMSFRRQLRCRITSREAQEEKTMATKKETTHQGVLGALQRFHVKLEANSADLAHLAVPRAQLTAVLTRVDEIRTQQGSMRAGKQEASQELKTLIAEGQRLGTGLR